jgi:hypothetical protein
VENRRKKINHRERRVRSAEVTEKERDKDNAEAQRYAEVRRGEEERREGSFDCGLRKAQTFAQDDRWVIWRKKFGGGMVEVLRPQTERAQNDRWVLMADEWRGLETKGTVRSRCTTDNSKGLRERESARLRRRPLQRRRGTGGDREGD